MIKNKFDLIYGGIDSLFICCVQKKNWELCMENSIDNQGKTCGIGILSKNKIFEKKKCYNRF